MLTSPSSQPPLSPAPPTRQRPRRRLTAEDRQRLAADLAENRPTAELAARYGVSRRAIQQFAARQRSAAAATETSTVLGVRLAPFELAALDALAGRLGLSRSGCARHVLRRASGFFDPDEELIGALQDLVRELGRIGTNVNQLAHHANRQALLVGQTDITASELSGILALREEIAGVSEGIGRLFGTRARRRRLTVDQVIRRSGAAGS